MSEEKKVTLKATPLFSGIILKEVRVREDFIAIPGSKVGLVQKNPNPGKRFVEAEVIKPGPGAYTDDGRRFQLTVRVGDRVIFEQTSGLPMYLEGDNYYLLEETRIILILHDKDGNSVDARLLKQIEDGKIDKPKTTYLKDRLKSEVEKENDDD